CRRCFAAVEDWNHVLHCEKVEPSVRQTIDTKAFDAMDQVLLAVNARHLSRSWIAYGSNFGYFLDTPEWFFGYCPRSWGRALAQYEKVEAASARQAIQAGMQAVRDIFIEQIWSPRCKAVNAWENAQPPPITRKCKLSRLADTN